MRKQGEDTAAKNVTINSAETPGLTLGLHQNKNIVLADGALDVTDDRARGVLEELHANLGDTTTRAGAAEDLGNLGELGLVDVLRDRMNKPIRSTTTKQSK